MICWNCKLIWSKTFTVFCYSLFRKLIVEVSIKMFRIYQICKHCKLTQKKSLPACLKLFWLNLQSCCKICPLNLLFLRLFTCNVATIKGQFFVKFSIQHLYWTFRYKLDSCVFVCRDWGRINTWRPKLKKNVTRFFSLYQLSLKELSI